MTATTDLQIAKEQAKMDTTAPVVYISLDDEYVSKLMQVRKITEENLKKEYKFGKKNDELDSKQKEELLKALMSTMEQQQSMTDTLLEEATPHKLSGPVAHQNSVLQDNIKMPAFHRRSFTGRHCKSTCCHSNNYLLCIKPNNFELCKKNC